MWVIPVATIRACFMFPLSGILTPAKAPDNPLRTRPSAAYGDNRREPEARENEHAGGAARTRPGVGFSRFSAVDAAESAISRFD
jgi:hypothetical protein